MTASGFYIRFNYCNAQNIIRYQKKFHDTVKLESNTNNYFIQYGSDDEPLSSCDQLVCLISGEIEGFDFQMDSNNMVLSIFKQIIFENNLDNVYQLKGDFILSLYGNNKLVIINSRCSQFDAFWRISENGIMASTILANLIQNDMNNLCLDNLILMCHGVGVMPFRGINVLKSGNVLLCDCAGTKVVPYVIPKNNGEPITKEAKSMLPEYGEKVFELIKKSVAIKTKKYKKVALALSGGIDSCVIARCLYELNKDTQLYTWSSKNKYIDEGKYADKIAQMYNMPLQKIYVDDFPNDIFPQKQAVYFPYIQPVSVWWEKICEFMERDNIHALLSGHFAGIFDKDFDYKILSKQCSLNRRLYYAYQAYANPYFKFHRFYKDEKFTAPLRYRKVDFFTSFAQEKLVNNYNVLSTFPLMRAQEYSYATNFFEPKGIQLISPYLNENLIDCAREFREDFLHYIMQVFQLTKFY